MKFLALIGACLAMSLAACGGGGSGSGAATADRGVEEPVATKQAKATRTLCPQGPTVMMSKAKIAKLPPLTIPRVSGPPPHRLQVIDLRKGSGPTIPADNRLANREKPYIRYLYASYPKASRSQITGRYGPTKYVPEELSKGVALGLKGMRVGGRREIIVPPKLAFPRWRPSWGYKRYVTVYLVDLLGMEPPPDRRVEYRHRPWHPCFAKAEMSKAEIAKLPPLRIPKASGPPPHRFIIIDLRRGSGRRVGKTDVVALRFTEDTYPQALRGRQGALSGGVVHWPRWPLPEASRAIHHGIPGMKVGGRRELIVPPKVAYPRWKPSWGYAPYVSIYVVDVYGAKPSSSPRAE